MNWWKQKLEFLKKNFPWDEEEVKKYEFAFGWHKEENTFKFKAPLWTILLPAGIIILIAGRC